MKDKQIIEIDTTGLARPVDYFPRKPRLVANRNVPDNAEIIGQISYMSGEIVDTYYCQRYHPAHPEFWCWALWFSAVWFGSKPQPASMGEMIEAGLIKDGDL